MPEWREVRWSVVGDTRADCEGRATCLNGERFLV